MVTLHANFKFFMTFYTFIKIPNGDVNQNNLI